MEFLHADARRPHGAGIQGLVVQLLDITLFEVLGKPPGESAQIAFRRSHGLS